MSSLRLNGSSNVELLPVAADVATGWAYYSTHVGSNGGLVDDGDLLAHPGVVVPTFRLDELVTGPVDFLKMDVEGAEGRVVRGATGIIERDRPVVTTELKDEMLGRVSGMSVRQYLGYFEDLGYRPTLLDKDGGAEKPYPSVDSMVDDWGEADNCATFFSFPEPPERRRGEAGTHWEVLVRIEGHDLPGLFCGPGPDYPDGHHNVHVAVQRRGKPAELLDLTPGDAFEAMWTLECTAKEGLDGVDIKGSYVRRRWGPLPLSLLGRAQRGGSFHHVPSGQALVDGVPPDIVERALSTGVLVGRLGLTDEDGWPLCASVRPPLIEWSAPGR